MDLLTWIGEVVTSIFKHGLSLTTLAVAVTALLRVNTVRKIILRRLPKRFRHADGHADKLDRIESKLDAISKQLGVDACGVSEIGTTGRTSLSKSYQSSVMELSQSTKSKGEHPMSNLLSGKKKFIALAIAIIINGVNDVFNLHLSANTLDATNYISGGYIAIEGILDFVRGINSYLSSKKATTVTTAVATVSSTSPVASVESSYHGE